MSSKLVKKNTRCPHTERPFYSKGMCKHCYHLKGRSKPAYTCPHPTKPNYARGLCRHCYLTEYHKAYKKKNSNCEVRETKLEENYSQHEFKDFDERNAAIQ